jgi:GGDEF domain-containing protein
MKNFKKLVKQAFDDFYKELHNDRYLKSFFINDADKCLYEAKSDGRDRIVVDDTSI